MSEPSIEAKQAAGECCEGLLDEAAMAHIIQQAIDTALTAKEETAKLREELEASTEHIKLLEADLIDQLAHQQPSVIRRNPNEDHRAAQSNAPAADKEKVARDIVEMLSDENLEQNKEQWITAVARELAQARAPLVAALEWYRDEARAVAKHKDGNTEALLASFHVLALDNGKRADAALTGTGEKEALAGRTGNNKQKGE